MLTREERSDLLNLMFHWDTAYRFEVIGGVWRAIPADDPAGVLTADSACDLRELVRADYQNRKRYSATADPGYRQERMST
jgi:hypothetical protein